MADDQNRSVFGNCFEHDCKHCKKKTVHIRHHAGGVHHATSCMTCGKVSKPF